MEAGNEVMGEMLILRHRGLFSAHLKPHPKVVLVCIEFTNSTIKFDFCQRCKHIENEAILGGDSHFHF